jgi:outer membrane protein OmpA-like peptidoglycan-associated protein
MRDIVFFIFVIAAIALSYTTVYSQEKVFHDDKYYVVIGAFKVPKNAMNWAEQARFEMYNAEYAWNEKRKLYYVYILSATSKQEAVELALKLQQIPKYQGTWVYTAILSADPQKISLQDTVTNADLTRPENSQQTSQTAPVEGTKQFIFRIRSLSTTYDVNGEVDVYDADIIKGRKAASYKGNEVVNVKPINKSGNLSVVCDVFGYRRLQIPVNFIDPKPGDGVTIEDNKVILTFELVRLKVGDKATMYHVYFFKDAAIMRPESRNEVNALLEYLNEKPNSRILLHGHTNGNAFGKVISMGDSKDFFALSEENKEGTSTAVKLSEERARIIQQYLVKQGIDESRMEVKGWGGKKPVYDEDHPAAAANVRVEVEVLRD